MGADLSYPYDKLVHQATKLDGLLPLSPVPAHCKTAKVCILSQRVQLRFESSNLCESSP